LYSERKKLLKTNKKSIWDNFPAWMGIYAIFQFIFSFYLILTQLSAYFAQWFFTFVNGDSEFVFYLSLFLVPVLSLIVSLVILLLLKNKLHKKIFMYIYIIHGVETLMAIGMLIYAAVN
jgi:hypothetical protein